MTTTTGPDLIFDCGSARDLFSGYLDGDISGREMHAMAAHLESCTGCGMEFETWARRAAHACRHRPGQGAPTTSASVSAWPSQRKAHAAAATGGTQSASAGRTWCDPWCCSFPPALRARCWLVGSIGLLIGVAADPPQAVQANDEPIGALTAPHYLYSMVRSQPVVTSEDTTIVIRADINERGQVYDYRILNGPSDPATLTQVRDQLLLQVYQPAEAFGLPVRGQVLITFSGVSVRA